MIEYLAELQKKLIDLSIEVGQYRMSIMTPKDLEAEKTKIRSFIYGDKDGIS